MSITTKIVSFLFVYNNNNNNNNSNNNNNNNSNNNNDNNEMISIAQPRPGEKGAVHECSKS